MRITLAQLNPVIGDVDGNARQILDAAMDAGRDGADLLITGELALLGYPPRDLLFREGVVESCATAVEHIAEVVAESFPDLTLVIGTPRSAPGERPFRNSAIVCRGGSIVATYDKRLLPGYDVFDDDRYFEPGDGVAVIDVSGRRVGLLICEDLWRAGDVLADRAYPLDPVAETREAGADVLVCLNASPFVVGKWRRHVEQIQDVAREHGVAVVAVNQVGADDDLVFDGRSLVVDAAGQPHAMLPGFESNVRTIDLPERRTGRGIPLPTEVDAMAECYDALVLAVRDYCHKTSHRRAVIGISGGIDSALTAVIAARALGAENVTGLFMASRYSSDISREDAVTLAKNLGLGQYESISIEQTHLAIHAALARPLRSGAGGVTDENVQSRLRGLLLMAFSNAGHGLLMATSNKSEMAAGYSTLYGDMCGAIAVIGDLLKTEVYAMARWINANPQRAGFESPPIPQRSITRAPTAELRPHQTDQDTLPPYETLDEIVRRFVDHEQSSQRIIDETGFDADLVHRIVRMIDAAQFKRDQSGVVPKLSPRTFGRGRPMPIVMKSVSFERAREMVRSAVESSAGGLGDEGT